MVIPWLNTIFLKRIKKKDPVLTKKIFLFGNRCWAPSGPVMKLWQHVWGENYYSGDCMEDCEKNRNGCRQVDVMKTRTWGYAANRLQKLIASSSADICPPWRHCEAVLEDAFFPFCVMEPVWENISPIRALADVMLRVKKWKWKDDGKWAS